MRPHLNPALRRVWRDERTLQLGVDPATAVVLGGLEGPVAALVERLDGSLDLAGVLATAARLGVDRSRAGALIDLLGRCGVLADGSGDPRATADLARSERDRLAPDLAAASIVRGGRDGGTAVLARRRRSVVAVHGAGRVGTSVVALLAAAGVGTVVVDDPGVVRAADVTPTGAGPEDVGTPRRTAATRAARRVAPSTRSALPRGRTRSDVALLADGPVPADLPDRLTRDGTSHLYAAVRDGTGVVGPLVLPGSSSCLRCHDLRRTDADPSWPRVAAQLAGRTEAGPVACDVVLATAVASHAALQLLAFLDTGPHDRASATARDLLPCVDGTLEVSQRDGRVRRRSWSPHPLCGCCWAG